MGRRRGGEEGRGKRQTRMSGAITMDECRMMVV